MESGSEGSNIFSQRHPTEASDKEFYDNVSMTSTVFQPPPREDIMTATWNCSDNCNLSLSNCTNELQVNTLRQMQSEPVYSKYLDNNCFQFLHDNDIGCKTKILAPPSSSCIPGQELCVGSDTTNAWRNSHRDSLNSGLFYGILPKGNNLDFCMNEQMKFDCNTKEQLVETENHFAVRHGSAIADTYGKPSKEVNKNSNNYSQYTTPEAVTKQNYNKTQQNYDKGQVYVNHGMTDFSASGSPNCLIVSNVQQNDSFEQICMLNTAVSYLCENEIQKILIKTDATAEINQNIHHILPPAIVNVTNRTPRQGNSVGDNLNINPCYKVNELKVDASHYFPEDMAKLIYEINSKLGTVPPSSTLNHVSQICETAKEYCEKYSHSTEVSGNVFKNLMTVFLQVAYSWVASYDSMKDISLFHPDLNYLLIKWKNSSEALLDVLIFAISNCHNNQLGTPDCNQTVNFKPFIYPSLSHTLSEKTSSPNFKNCQYISETSNECCFYNTSNENKEIISKRNNSCITDNNVSGCNFSNSPVTTFHHRNNNVEHTTKRQLNKTEDEDVPHSSQFLDVQHSQGKKNKNCDTKIPRPFIDHFKNHRSSNETKSFMTYNNTKTNSEEENGDVGTGSSDNVNMLHTQNRSTPLSKKFSKSDFTIKHPGILPITCLAKTNTMSTFDCRIHKETESTFEHHLENPYTDEHQKLKSTSTQQPICSGRMTRGGKQQLKRPFTKIGGKRTKTFGHSQDCDSDTSETYEYLRPGSYKVPMKYSAGMHNKSYNQGIFHSSFKLDPVDGINNKRVMNDTRTCFSKTSNRSPDTPHETDSKVQLNDSHHKSNSRDEDLMEKMDKPKSMMPNYSKHSSSGKRPTVYWNKNEHQLPRCYSYYNARQRERFCHKRTEDRDRNKPCSSLNSKTPETFEQQIPVIENRQNFSIMKKCKLENNTFTAT